MVKRNRENFITIYMNNQELQELNEKVALTNMSREEYLRMIIKGCQPVAKPDIEYKGGFEAASLYREQCSADSSQGVLY